MIRFAVIALLLTEYYHSVLSADCDPQESTNVSGTIISSRRDAADRATASGASYSGEEPASMETPAALRLQQKQLQLEGADNLKGESNVQEKPFINRLLLATRKPELAIKKASERQRRVCDDGLGGSGGSVRVRRSLAASRRKVPRVQLAQRPKGTSTTTTTTTTPVTTEAEAEEEQATATTAKQRSDAASESENGEYEYEDTDDEEPAKSPETAAKQPSKNTEATITAPPPQPTTTTVMMKSGASGKKKERERDSEKKGRKSEWGGNKKTDDNSGGANIDNTSKGKTNKQSGQVSDSNTATMTTASILKKKKPLVTLPFIKPKNSSICTPEAYLEFPRDLIGNKWRGRGLVIIHIAVVCYMFYSLALVCERYFMPSLEEFAQRLQLSEDVAGATLMSAGSSAPELFTAILGVFVAKGDVGTGAIVGSAVFNILFVIGICAFVSTATAQLNWWPVLRDSVFYTFTVLVLILFIYDERITAFESFSMIALYGVYILIMAHNETLKEQVTRSLLSHPITAKLINSSTATVEGPDDVFGSTSSNPLSSNSQKKFFGNQSNQRNYQTTSMIGSEQQQKSVEDDSMFLAACLVIVQHKRLFRSQLRFQSAARYIIIKRQHRVHQQRQKSLKCSNEVNYFGPESEPLKPSGTNQRERMEAYARSAPMSKNKFSIVSKDDYEFWNRPPQEGENYYLWLAKIPVNYVLHYTIPDCALYPDKYLFTFVISICWTAFFSYIMVWMVTLIGYTMGIPDSIMGVTFLAAGTSVPDCYSSIHAARNGMADMAVSNSIGSNVFDILIGLSLPWFIQTAIYPGVVATINSRGVIYSVILLFFSLVITIYLMNKYEWTLKPRLGLALLIAYGLFIILTCMLEFNLFGHVNPPPCLVGWCKASSP